MTKKQASKQTGSLQGNKPDYPAPTKRTQGRKVAEKESSVTENITERIKLTFDTLNDELKKAGYEMIIRRPVSKELAIFDYGLMFKRGSKEVQVYIDEDLQVVIDHLLETNKQLIIKSNWLSPDTVAIHVPLDSSTEMPVEATGTTESDDNAQNIVE